MIKTELLIIGGGPAGLAASLAAAEAGVSSIVVDRNQSFGGQLIKQTHKFFGSEKQYAKTRGINIAKKMIEDTHKYENLITLLCDTTVLGVYPDLVATCLKDDKYYKIKAQAVIVATGAYEKTLAFENNDLPGIYGAGAVQTLMNVYGIKPGNKIIMVGSGNIGLIVSYQLLQAGIKVEAVLEAAPRIGGYKVHAAKLRRYGIPIITSRTVLKAHGEKALEGITTIALNENWEMVAGSEEYYEADALCLAVGLSPLSNIFGMLNVEMKYIPELGGLVPVLRDNYMTSVENIYACGDVAGIEEASSAIVEGRLAGFYAANGLKRSLDDKEINDCKKQLQLLRCGPTGEKIRSGLEKRGEGNA